MKMDMLKAYGMMIWRKFMCGDFALAEYSSIKSLLVLSGNCLPLGQEWKRKKKKKKEKKIKGENGQGVVIKIRFVGKF